MLNEKINRVGENMLRKIIDFTLSLNSLTHPELDFKVGDKIVDELLELKGVSEVSHYATYIITCSPNGTTNQTILSDLERIQTQANDILRKHDALSKEAMIIDEKVEMASALSPSDDMLPSVFKVTLLDGSTHYGCNFQPVDSAVGDRFHYDYGAGIEKNTDAQVVWMMR